MLRIFFLAMSLLIAAGTGLLLRRIYVDQKETQGVARFYVGGQLVTVERAMVRNPDLREGGAVNRLDLALSWPLLNAAGANVSNGKNLIFLALEDATQASKTSDDIDPADRPMALYSRFLDPEPTTAIDGLVMRKFKPGTPYEGEDLYVSTPDERVFSARCPHAGGNIDQLCLWQARISGMEIHTRFAPAHLQNWNTLADAVRALVPRLVAAPRG